MKKILPHILSLGIIVFLLDIVFRAMMSTNNNGEFGYAEQGIYAWGEILLTLLPWFAFFFLVFELPLLLYQFTKSKADKMKK